MHLGAQWNTSPHKGPARYPCLVVIAVALRWLKYCRTLLPSPRSSAFPVVQCVLNLQFRLIKIAPCSTALPSSGGSRLFWPHCWQPQSCCLCTVRANAEEVLPGIWNDKEKNSGVWERAKWAVLLPIHEEAIPFFFGGGDAEGQPGNLHTMAQPLKALRKERALCRTALHPTVIEHWQTHYPAD